MKDIGMPELSLILVIVFIFSLISLIPAWRIARKAGYSPALGLLFVVPVVKMIVLYIFAFSDWPIERAKSDRS